MRQLATISVEIKGLCHSNKLAPCLLRKGYKLAFDISGQVSTFLQLVDLL